MLAVPHTTSPPPSEGSPEASSPPCPPATKAPSASLGTLPYELKEDIVEHLMRSIERDNPHEADQHAVGFFAARDEEGNSTTYAEWEQNAQLRALSVLDREFSSICLARIYKTVNVHWRDAASLQAFVDDIAPRQAQNVRCLRLNPGRPRPPIQNVPNAMRRRAEAAALRTLEADRSGLVDKVLRCCSATTELRIVAHLGGAGHDSDEYRREMMALRAIADTTRNLGSVLEILMIEFGDRRASGMCFIPSSDTLTSLSLLYPDTSTRNDFAAVSHGLRSLPHLKHLRLATAGLLDDDFLRQTFVLPLESLELSDTKSKASFVLLHAFVDSFADTLTMLNLDLGCAARQTETIWPVPAGLDFHLPHLAFLALSTHFDSSVFLRFPPPPALALLHVGRIAQDGHALDRLVELVGTRPLAHLHLDEEAQEEGLRRHFEEDWVQSGLRVDEVDTLAAACAERDVAFSGEVPRYVAPVGRMYSYGSGANSPY